METDFPGGAVIRALCFHCSGAQFRSLVGDLRSCMPCGVAKKKKKELLVNLAKVVTVSPGEPAVLVIMETLDCRQILVLPCVFSTRRGPITAVLPASQDQPETRNANGRN